MQGDLRWNTEKQNFKVITLKICVVFKRFITKTLLISIFSYDGEVFFVRWQNKWECLVDLIPGFGFYGNIFTKWVNNAKNNNLKLLWNPLPGLSFRHPSFPSSMGNSPARTKIKRSISLPKNTMAAPLHISVPISIMLRTLLRTLRR